MKQFKLFFAVAAIITGMASCSKDESPEPTPQVIENYDEVNVEAIMDNSPSLSDGDIEAIDGFPVLQEGSVLVYQTDEGRFGKIEIVDYDFNNNHLMTFNFVTYTLDNDGSIYSMRMFATVQGTWLFDLDNGVQGVGAGMDFWWERVNANYTIFNPTNGASFHKFNFNN